MAFKLRSSGLPFKEMGSSPAKQGFDPTPSKEEQAKKRMEIKEKNPHEDKGKGYTPISKEKKNRKPSDGPPGTREENAAKSAKGYKWVNGAWKGTGLTPADTPVKQKYDLSKATVDGKHPQTEKNKKHEDVDSEDLFMDSKTRDEDGNVKDIQWAPGPTKGPKKGSMDKVEKV